MTFIPGSLKTESYFVGSRSVTIWPISSLAQFLFLESEDPDKDIHMYVNSPGLGDSGPAIYDIHAYVGPDVVTICMGQSTSMAACFLPPGQRETLLPPPSRIMIHQPLGAPRVRPPTSTFRPEDPQGAGDLEPDPGKAPGGQPLERISGTRNATFS